ncbi:unnamed protein product, partial [Mesorhabditis belari]|uniref:PPM-type phosphatase domain-containing protein n=1 Tax=Mesorhabditis belari TaxID=2138241 RepID=A0AAF3ETH9_9BILA
MTKHLVKTSDRSQELFSRKTSDRGPKRPRLLSDPHTKDPNKQNNPNNIVFKQPSSQHLGSKMEEIADDLLDSAEKCENAGMGISSQIYYYKGGRTEPHGEPPDIAFHVKTTQSEPDTLRVFGLFTGYNGSTRFAKYAANRMVFEMLMEPNHLIKASDNNDKILDVMRESFDNVERIVNEEIKEKLSHMKIMSWDLERLQPNLQNQDTYRTIQSRITDLNNDLKAGSTALVVMMIEKRLFVLNCGNSRLLLVSMEADKPRCELLNDVHDCGNNEEQKRLSDAGVDTANLAYVPTRGIGDTFHKKDFAPDGIGYVVPEPGVFRYELDPSCQYLIIISSGVFKNVKESMKHKESNKVITDEAVNWQIMDYVLHEVKNAYTPSYTSIAQGTLDLIGRVHFDNFAKGEMDVRIREGMSLLLVDLTASAATEYPVSQLLDTQLSITSFDQEIEPYVDIYDIESQPNRKEIIADLKKLEIFDCDSLDMIE